MSRILIVAKQNRDNEGLCNSLDRKDFNCSMTPDDGRIREKLTENPPDIVLVETNDPARLNDLARLIKQGKNPPVIALLDANMLEIPQLSLRAHSGEAGSRSNPGLDLDLSYIDDFVVRPYRLTELETRIKKLLRREIRDTAEQIKRGDMVIDLGKCEVSVSGRPILLTFKEYELLKFLAGNPERVFSRDALLNKVWGYEYYGGDRTVDVHVKRLRSKIEDGSHSFVETVRNIGYRFKVT